MSGAHADTERWRGARVAVWGAARSGIAAANALVELGATVVLSDTRARDQLLITGKEPASEFLDDLVG